MASGINKSIRTIKMEKPAAQPSLIRQLISSIQRRFQLSLRPESEKLK